MLRLNMSLSDEEKIVLSKYAGVHFELLPYIEGDSYVLNENGTYYYNECINATDIAFFAQQKYKKVTPYRVIKFYQEYFMDTKEEIDSWYRGRKDSNGNWEYDCVSDSLEEAFECWL